MERTIYVAGGSNERITVVRPLMDRLRAAGWTITHDWTHDPGYDDPLIAADVSADLGGVVRALYFWIVLPESKSEGASFEAGYALGTESYIVASGLRVESNVFLSQRADRKFRHHEDALRWLVEMPA